MDVGYIRGSYCGHHGGHNVRVDLSHWITALQNISSSTRSPRNSYMLCSPRIASPDFRSFFDKDIPRSPMATALAPLPSSTEQKLPRDGRFASVHMNS